MQHKYTIYTSIPRNFDPDVEGVTLDSIVGSCNGIINYGIPGSYDNVRINMTLDRPLEKNNFAGDKGDNVVLGILRKK